MPTTTRRAVTKALGVVALASLPRLRMARAAGRHQALVIGAGIAGLSAAYDLQKGGFAVIVFEKASIAGGRMLETWTGPLYGGTHAGGVLQASQEMFSLAREIGIEQQLHGDVPYDASMMDNGRGVYFHTLRFRTEEVGKVPGISDETRRRLPALQDDLATLRAEVDPCQVSTGARYDNGSLLDYYESRLGKAAAKEVIDYWVDPALDAWGWPIARTSPVPLLAWFAQQDAKFLIPRGGIGVLTRKLATLVDVRLNTTAMHVTPPDTNGRHTVHYLDAAGERRSLTPDVMVCATEGKYVIPMVQGLNDAQWAFFGQIDFTKYAAVSYVLKSTVMPKPAEGRYIPNHPNADKRRIYSWAISPADPKNHNRPATAYLGLSRLETPKWQVANVPLPDYCLPLLQKVYPAVTADMIDDVVVHAGDDLVYIPPGFVRQMAEFLRAQERERRSLYYVGEYLGNAHTGGACASGRRAARTILKHWA